MLSRIAAEEEARTTREVRVAPPPGPELLAEAERRFGARLVEAETGAAFQVAGERCLELCEWLVANGARRVTAARLDAVFTAAHPLLDRLEGRIGAAPAGFPGTVETPR